MKPHAGIAPLPRRFSINAVTLIFFKASYSLLGTVVERVLRRVAKPVSIIPLPKGETDITLGEI